MDKNELSRKDNNTNLDQTQKEFLHMYIQSMNLIGYKITKSI